MMQAIQTANLHSVTQNAFLTDELPLTIISYYGLSPFKYFIKIKIMAATRTMEGSFIRRVHVKDRTHVMNKKALKKQHIYIFSIFLNPYDLITMISIQQKVFKIIY